MMQGQRRRAGLALCLLALAVTFLLGSVPSSAGSSLRLADSPHDLVGGQVVSTLPAVAGYPVAVDGVTHVTDQQGRVTLPRSAAVGPPLSGRISTGTATITQDGRPVAVRTSKVTGSSDGVVLWVELSYPVHFSYVAPNGSAIPATRLTSVRLRSRTGEVVDAVPGQDLWLTGTRVANVGGHPEARDVDWSVQEILSSGSNVVNASQQRFRPTAQSSVAIEVLFFSMAVSTDDAFFGFATGDSVTLSFPDGHGETRSLDAHGRTSFPLLPRGDYTVTTHGPGPDMSRPLAISGDQAVDLALYSWLDLGVLVGAVLGLFAVLLWSGTRRRRRHALARTVPPVVPAVVLEWPVPPPLVPVPRPAPCRITARPPAGWLSAELPLPTSAVRTLSHVP